MVSASRLELPGTLFTRTTEFNADTIAKQTNHNGDFYAPRLEGALTAYVLPGFSLALGGFYATYDNEQNTTCTPTLSVRCAVISIVDDPLRAQTTIAYTSETSNGMFTSTDRTVDHWGISMEAKFHRWFSGFTPLLGIDYRRLDQSLRMDAVLDQTPIGWVDSTMSYREKLDTRYLGLYVGAKSTRIFIAPQWYFSLEGRVGLYHADANYRGLYNAQSGHPFSDSADLRINRDKLAVAGAVKAETGVELSQGLSLSVFGILEGYSWAPKMKYNDHDVQPNYTVNGINQGTSIGDGTAFAYSGGVRLAIRW